MTEDRNAALEALETLKKCAYKSPLDGIISLHGDIEIIAPHYGVLVLALERFLESQTGEKRQAAPEGWKLVPIEPTQEMDKAWFDSGANYCVDSLRSFWSDVISAAPTADDGVK